MDAPTKPTTTMAEMLPDQVKLIQAVAAANPNTVVVLNTADPVIVKPWIDNPNVKAVLEMWNAGSEGSTATARLLLGQANPSGHTAITWPRNGTDLFWTYNETKPLYPGATHRRASRAPQRPAQLRHQRDRRASTPATATTTRRTSSPSSRSASGSPTPRSGSRTSSSRRALTGPSDVDFDVKNTGSVAGAEVAQVYVGPGPEVPGIQQAVRSLRGFDRASLQPGQTVARDGPPRPAVVPVLELADASSGRPTTARGRSGSATPSRPTTCHCAATTAPLASTSTTGTVGGTVPATLSLASAAPASFGAFMPGLGA